MGTPNIQIPITDLEAVSTQMSAMKADLDGVESGANDLEGVDDLDGKKLRKAVESFLDEWKGSRKTLLENVELLGMVSGEIANVATQFNSEAASGLSDAAGQIRGAGSDDA